MQFAIAEIKIPERQREDYGDVEEMSKSFKRLGQLQPILVNHQNELVVGGRRLAAAMLLKWTHIWAEYRDEADPIILQEIELEENLRRKQLEWPEEAKAVKKIHTLKLATDPNWTAEKTAALLGLSRRHVFNYLGLADAIDQFPEVTKADTITGGMQRLQRLKQLDDRRESAKAIAVAGSIGVKPSIRAEIQEGDALATLRTLADNSADGVITNPPFGVGIQELFTADKKIYEDRAEEIVPLLEGVIHEVYRILKDNRWFVLFWPTRRLDEVIGVSESTRTFIREVLSTATFPTNGADLIERRLAGFLQSAGFSFQAVPCVWYKPNKRVSSLGQPYKEVNINYETFLFARKGDANFHKIPASTVYTYDTPSRDRAHPLEMPVSIWTDILESIAVAGEFVVEPFSGSGSGGEAAVGLGINYLGLELDPQYVADSKARLIHAVVKGPRPKADAPTENPENALRALRSMDLMSFGLEMEDQ
jgi:ParB/RepB/Spo0J family partition protein